MSGNLTPAEGAQVQGYMIYAYGCACWVCTGTHRRDKLFDTFRSIAGTYVELFRFIYSAGRGVNRFAIRNRRSVLISTPGGKNIMAKYLGVDYFNLLRPSLTALGGLKTR